MEFEEFQKRCLRFLCHYVPFEDNRCYVAGGFFPRFYHNLPLRDIDIFVNDDDKMGEICKEFISHPSFCYVRSTNSKKCSVPTLMNFTTKDRRNNNPLIIQVVRVLDKWIDKKEKKRYKQIVSQKSENIDNINNVTNTLAWVYSFDFTICRVMAISNNLAKIANDYADIQQKKLRYTNNKIRYSNKQNILTRIKKYTDLGFEINEAAYSNIFYQIRENSELFDFYK